MTNIDEVLNPENVQENLLRASLYLTVYELLKSAIIENIRQFFTFDYRDGKPVPDQQYIDEVIRAHKDVLFASCLWLQSNGVIESVDIDNIRKIRSHRNQIAHELPEILFEPTLRVDEEHFWIIRALLTKIELWWMKNFDIPANSDFDDLVIGDEEIHPGRVVTLDYIIITAGLQRSPAVEPTSRGSCGR